MQPPMPPRPAPSAQAPSRAPTRRMALAAVLLGTASLGAWQWPPRWRRAPAAAADAAMVGDDVCVVAPTTPYDPALGQPPQVAREVPPEARCPVCGMFPARARDWAAQVIFADGDAQFLDSPLSLMMYLGNVGHYARGRTAQAIVARYVTDADTGAWLDARQALYVHGSSARGPMRAGNLPAFADAAAAQHFAQRRGGRVLGFSAIDAALLRSLAPGRRQDHAVHAGPPQP
ncbi:hypothetical protein GmRootA79_41970 [Acidovorax sp. A79]